MKEEPTEKENEITKSIKKLEEIRERTTDEKLKELCTFAIETNQKIDNNY